MGPLPGRGPHHRDAQDTAAALEGSEAQLTTGSPASVAVVDTDVVIDHLRGHRRMPTLDGPIAYSVVTRAELFGGTSPLDEVRELLDGMIEVPVDRAIAESGGVIRGRHGTDLPDALIAATAIHLDVPLLTRNLRDYKPIKGLKVRAPA